MAVFQVWDSDRVIEALEVPQFLRKSNRYLTMLFKFIAKNRDSAIVKCLSTLTKLM